MKKLILSISILLTFLCGISQIRQPLGTPKGTIQILGNIWVDSMFYMPIRTDSDRVKMTVVRPGAVYLFAKPGGDTIPFMFTGREWIKWLKLSDVPSATLKQVGVYNIASLRANSYDQVFVGGKTAPSDQPIANLLGYDLPGDGGGGPLWFDAASTESDDSATVFRPNSIAFGSPGRWKRFPEYQFNVLRAGAKRDNSVTDNRQPVYRAQKASSVLYFPGAHDGSYYGFADSLNFIVKKIAIIGDGKQETKLRFASGKKGIKIGFPYAQDSRLEELSIESLSSPTLVDTVTMGFIARSYVYMKNVDVNGFPGAGFDLRASIGEDPSNPNYGNTSLSIFINCQAFYNGWHGFYITGADANAMTFLDCSSRTNGSSGFENIGFLGNNFDHCHTASNSDRIGSLSIAYVANLGDTTYYTANRSNTNIKPGSVADPYGYWWHKFPTHPEEKSFFNVWDSTKHYQGAGSYAMRNGNNYSQLSGTYSEGNQVLDIIEGNALVLGGDMAAGFAPCCPNSPSDAVARISSAGQALYAWSNFYYHSQQGYLLGLTVTGFTIQGDNDTWPLAWGWDSTAAHRWFRMQYGNGVWSNAWVSSYNTPASVYGKTQWYPTTGKNSSDLGVYMFSRIKLQMPNGTFHNFSLTDSLNPPTSLLDEWSPGDYIQYNGTADSTLQGFLCTFGGVGPAAVWLKKRTGNGNSGNYIFNQTIFPGQSASFNITGKGIVTGGFESRVLTDSTSIRNGYQALLRETGNNHNNTAMGYQALMKANTNSVDNTGVGYKVMVNDSSVSTTGPRVDEGHGIPFISGFRRNTALGSNALAGDPIYGNGTDNVAVGYTAMFNNASGSHNTAIGKSAGFALTYGSRNVFIGQEAGSSINSGNGNIIISARGTIYSDADSTMQYQIRIGTRPENSSAFPLIMGDQAKKNLTINGSFKAVDVFDTSGIVPWFNASPNMSQMLFNALNGSFKIGYIGSGNQWDSAHTGTYSVGMGFQPTASGLHSVALGSSVISSGTGAFAAGISSLAAGNGSISMGLGDSTTGIGSIALGGSIHADGAESVGLGYNNLALADFSISVGISNINRSVSSITVGNGLLANIPGQIIMGKYNDTTLGIPKLWSVGKGWGNAGRSDAAWIDSFYRFYTKYLTNATGTLQWAFPTSTSSGTLATLKDITDSLMAYDTFGIDLILPLRAPNYHTFSVDTVSSTNSGVVTPAMKATWDAGGGGSGWALNGNIGTGYYSKLGTTDNRSLGIWTNNIRRAVFDSLGNFTINHSSTDYLNDYAGNLTLNSNGFTTLMIGQEQVGGAYGLRLSSDYASGLSYIRGNFSSGSHNPVTMQHDGGNVLIGTISDLGPRLFVEGDARTSVKSGYTYNIDGSLGNNDWVTKKYTDSTITAGAYTGVFFSTITLMQSYTGSANLVIVTDTLAGGIFYWTSTALVDDNGVVYAATGKGSGHWKRVFRLDDGVSSAWWQHTIDSTSGTNGAKLQAALTYVQNNSIKKLHIVGARILLEGHTGALLNLVNEGLEVYGDGMGKTKIIYPNSAINSNTQIFNLSGNNQTVHDIYIQNLAQSGSADFTGLAVNTGAFYPNVYKMEFSGMYGNGTAGGSGITAFQAWNQPELQTTLGSSFASGSQTATPASMNGISVGSQLHIVGSTTEDVVVTAITQTTFTATYVNARTNTDVVTKYSQGRQYGNYDQIYVHDSWKCSGMVLNCTKNVIRAGKFIHIGSATTQHGLYLQGGQNWVGYSYFEGIVGYGIHGHKAVANIDASGDQYVFNTFVDCQQTAMIVDATPNGTLNTQLPNTTPLNRYNLVEGNTFRNTLGFLPSASLPSLSVQAPSTVVNNLWEDMYTVSGETVIFSAAAPGSVFSGNRMIHTNTIPSGGTMKGVRSLADNMQIVNNPQLDFGDNQITANGNLWSNNISTDSRLLVDGNNNKVINSQTTNATSDALAIISGNAHSGNIWDNFRLISSSTAKLGNFDFVNQTNLTFRNLYFPGANNYFRYQNPNASIELIGNWGSISQGGNASFDQYAGSGRLAVFPFAASASIAAGNVLKNPTSMVKSATTDSTIMDFAGIATSTLPSAASSAFVVNQPGATARALTTGAWVAGDYAVISTTVAGTFKDGGSTLSTTATAYGIFTDAGGGSGTATLTLISPSRAISNNTLSSFQTISAGTTTTVTTGNTIVYINPASVLATHTITTPASPQNGQTLEIHAGGTIAIGAPVVTTFTLTANTGTSMYQAITPTTLNGGDVIMLRYESSTTLWRRVK